MPQNTRFGYAKQTLKINYIEIFGRQPTTHSSHSDMDLSFPIPVIGKASNTAFTKTLQISGRYVKSPDYTDRIELYNDAKIFTINIYFVRIH